MWWGFFGGNIRAEHERQLRHNAILQDEARRQNELVWKVSLESLERAKGIHDRKSRHAD